MRRAKTLVEVVTRPEAAEAAYAKLRASMNTSCVGVDCEGTNFGRAMMVQIATHSMVIVETPIPGRPLSLPLQRLLMDAKTKKVFFGANADLAALQCTVNNVADLQTMCPTANGNVIGLSAALTHLDPASRQWSKQSFSANGWHRLRSGAAMRAATGFVQYAAADAWGTLLGYSWLTGDSQQRQLQFRARSIV